MQYVSTRGGVPAASYSEIVLQGLARDGGLFVPKVYPQVSKETLKNWARPLLRSARDWP